MVAARRTGATMSAASRVKVGVAVVSLVVAGVLIAGSLGVFSVGRGTSGPTMSEEEAAEVDRELKEAEETMARRGVSTGKG